MAQCFLIVPVKNPTKEIVNELMSAIVCFNLLLTDVQSIDVDSHVEFEREDVSNAVGGLTYIQFFQQSLKLNWQQFHLQVYRFKRNFARMTKLIILKNSEWR